VDSPDNDLKVLFVCPAVWPYAALQIGDQPACEIALHRLSRNLIGSLALFQGSGLNLREQFFRKPDI
jgi:hypothetical protein